MNFLSNKRQVLIYINRIFQVLLIAGVIVLITPTKSSFKYEFQQGHYWKHENLIAPFDFAIKKSDKELDKEKEELSENKKFFFDYNKDITAKTIAEIHSNIKAKCTQNNIPNNTCENIIYKIDNILDKILTHGIVSKNAKNTVGKNSDIVLVNQNIAQERQLEDFYTINDVEEIVHTSLKSSFNAQIKDYDFIADIITKALTPNIIFNKQKTDEILSSSIKDISEIKGLISKNETIISKGELITEEKYQILSSLKTEYEGAEKQGVSNILSNFGQYLLIVIALGAMTLFVYNTDKSIFLNNKKILLIYTVILLMIAMTMLVLHFKPEFLFVVPICLAPILIRTFFDTKVSLYVFLVSIIIIGFSVPNSFEFIFYQLIVGMMAILSVEHLEKRSEFFNTSWIVFLTYSIIYIAMHFIQNGDIKQLDINRFIFFAGNAIFLLFAFPIVFILEKMFGLVSEMSLLEYCNTNTKILRELSTKAPGTFQHSIQVANIAEEVIHLIGGNSLLIRAGSLHHDIGKIANPVCFIENQVSGVNPLNDMTNEESSQTIVSHVANGIKLAHKYSLPEPIIDFIRTHHGTSATKYFYNKEVNENPDRNVDIKLFSYKGPRPFSKETAVLMMVDSVEAASRSLKEHSEESISKLVESIVDSQIADKQYDDAEITLSDINKIKKILKRKLQSIYHVRIEYPVNKKEVSK